MAPVIDYATRCGIPPQFGSAAVAAAWVNQAAGRHGHFGLKSAPQHRDFRPEKEGDS